MKIVVRGTNWIGDAIMTVPALRQLRQVFPEAHISLHTGSWAYGIFRDVDFIDEILRFDNGSTALQMVRSQARLWHKKQFDLAILLTNSFQTALLSKLGGVKTRFGYRNEGRSFLLTNPVAKPTWRSEKHEVFYYLNLVAAVEDSFFGTRESFEIEPDNSLSVSDERKDRARKTLRQSGVDLSRSIVALGVGSTNSLAKRWTPEGYAALNDKIQEEIGANVILIGSEGELDVSQLVFDLSKVKPVVLTGKTSLEEVVAMLSELDLLVSNDMGLAHVSSAVGTNTVTIFGPTDPKTTAPWHSEIIVRNDVECAPCMLRNCPIDHPCMKLILPNEVFERAKKFLN